MIKKREQMMGGHMALGLSKNVSKPDESEEIVLRIAAIVQGIRFGSVEVVIHDGRIVQIDKRERFRINEQKSTA